MSFKVVSNPTFKHEVKISVPVDGGQKEEKLTTVFRAVAADQIEPLDLTTLKDQDKFFDLVIDRFEDLVDESGTPTNYTPDIRRQLLGLSYVRVGMMQAYGEAMAKAARKN